MENVDIKITENDEKDDSRGAYKEFRELLQRGIGLRTQKEFAEATGISRSHLNRMLNQELISRPSRETLRALAKCMNSVTYEELLVSCGYDAPLIDELVDAMMANIEDFFGCKGRECFVVRGSFEDMCESFKNSCCLDDVEKIRYDLHEENAYAGEEYPDADFTTKIDILWNTESYVCDGRFAIYYSKTSSGKKVVFGMQLEQCEATPLQGAGLMNEDGEKLYPVTFVGHGISYDKTPDNFKAFLANHRASFCTDEERVDLWQRVVMNGEDPDEVFKYFLGGDMAWNAGTGAAVAAIMAVELEDADWEENTEEFLYYSAEGSVDGSGHGGFVMVRNELDAPEGMTIEYATKLYMFAKELGSKTFGQCYYHTVLPEETEYVFSVDTFDPASGDD